MSCFNPNPIALLTAPGGSRSVLFNPKNFHEGEEEERQDGYKVRFMYLPCGKCDACLATRSREWALRCMHEAFDNEHNCFITLTYNDENLPADNALHKDHFQKFMKRLRKRFGKCRFFACGEYGDQGSRPHYHAILFGLDFNATCRLNDGVNWFKYSPELADLWKFGFSSVGECNFQTCAYVARYCVKKLGKEELGDRAKEFVLMSNRPGIGRKYAEDNTFQNLESGFCVSQGRKIKVPRYYDKVSKQLDPVVYEHYYDERMKKIKPIDWARIEQQEKFCEYLKTLKKDKKI